MLRGQPLKISSGRRRFKIFLIRSLHGKTKIRRETNRRPGRWHDQVIVLHVRHSCSLEFTCGEGASFVTLKAHALMDFLSNFLVKTRGKSEELVRSFLFSSTTLHAPTGATLSRWRTTEIVSLRFPSNKSRAYVWNRNNRHKSSDSARTLTNATFFFLQCIIAEHTPGGKRWADD